MSGRVAQWARDTVSVFGGRAGLSERDSNDLAVARVVLAAEEVIASLPATYDETHLTVKRHAAALLALAKALGGGW